MFLPCGEICQGEENKTAPVQMRMRQGEDRRAENYALVQQEIQVEGAVEDALGPFPPGGAFQAPELEEQGPGGEGGLYLRHQVQEPVGRNEPHRFGEIDR